MKNQKFNAKPWLMKTKVQDGYAIIYIRIYVNSSRAEISTLQKVKIDYWCSKTNRVKNSYQEATRLNSIIDRMVGQLKTKPLWKPSTYHNIKMEEQSKSEKL
jgi:hypothetical protein